MPGPKSKRNLWIAFIEEAKANRLYTAYAQRAREEGHAKAAEIFEKVAEDETRHALNHLKALGAIKSTAENLTEVIAEESAEAGGAFPRMLEQVRAEGDKKAEESLRIALEDSLGHVKLFEEALVSVGGAVAPSPALRASSPASGRGQGEGADSPEISEEKGRIAKLERIREVVFGTQDGLLSTMAVGATVMLATHARFPTLMAGLATAMAGTVSMASGAYLGSQSEQELHQAEIDKEREELKDKPDEEIAELLQVLRQEGHTYEEALKMAERIGSDPELMLRTQAEKELGLPLDATSHANPVSDAMVMGVCFFLGSFAALLPYFFMRGRPAVAVSVSLSLVALFVIGMAKTLVTRKNPWASGLTVLGVGTLSAVASWLLGEVLPRIVLGH